MFEQDYIDKVRALIGELQDIGERYPQDEQMQKAHEKCIAWLSVDLREWEDDVDSYMETLDHGDPFAPDEDDLPF